MVPTRRDILRFGTISLGGTLLPGTARGGSRVPRARACILLFMDGGPSQIDLLDMKPDAPAEIRGPFQPISTTVPGLQICEHLPRLAREMHRVALVRSVRHEEMVHDPAVYQALTGRKHQNTGGGLTVDASDFPQIGAAFAAADRRPGALPKAIELPETMKMGARILPGQSAGFLGATRDPFRVTLTPDGSVAPPEFTRLPDVSAARAGRRRSLLGELNHRRGSLQSAGEAGVLDGFQRQALALLNDPRIGAAFDLSREPAQQHEQYGRHRHGQSVLLARRLVEAGARFVTVYWGHEDQDWADGKGKRPANNPWDTHRNHFPLVRDDLVPRADQALSALLADLAGRGLLEETLVVWMGEFGRSPKISEWASREHWPYAYSLLMAGAGIPGGAIYGKTDAWAGEVVENPVSPADISATILTTLGVDPSALIQDQQGRPYPLSHGRPIEALIGADRPARS